MANVKTITATTTESAVEFNATYQFMWFRNYGENDCYICAHSGIVANADDVTLLKAGEVARLTLPQTPAQSKAYIKAADGSNTVEVHAQNFSDVPFKSRAKGGGQSITVTPLSVTANGTYTAPTGKAYSPVSVDVQEEPWQPLQDGYSNFWFDLTNDTLSPWLNFSAKNANATIDWGDGSGEVALDTLTPTHTYSKAGKYVVKVKGVTGIARMQLVPYNSPYTKVLKYIELNNEIGSFTQTIAFGINIGLTNVVFNGTNCNIASSAFIYCASLENITLPSELTAIPAQMFGYCLSLRKIIIPSSIESIGTSSFQSCLMLKEIHCQATTPPTLGINVFSTLSTQDNWFIYVPVGYGNTYKSAAGWSTYADHILEEGQTPNRMMLAKFNSTKTEEVKDDELYQDNNR